MDDDAARSGSEGAKAFLEVLRQDDELSQRLDQVVDDQILSVSRALASERGFSFTPEELQQAVVDRLSLGEISLVEDDGGAGKCKSDSGCRTPCVYCKSNRAPTLGDIGEIILEQRRILE